MYSKAFPLVLTVALRVAGRTRVSFPKVWVALQVRVVQLPDADRARRRSRNVLDAGLMSVLALRFSTLRDTCRVFGS